MEAFTASKNERHPADMAMLQGARLVSASETEQGRAWAENRIKQITGGDQISARFMRQDFFTYIPQFKLVLVGNHKPVLRNVDDAAKRRFNIVPFTTVPKARDKNLQEKLKAEAPAILQWMIEGCMDWQENGLIRPQAVIDATEAYFDDQDIMRQWIEDRYRIEPENSALWTSTGVLFKDWCEFAERAGEKPGTQKSLTQYLIKLGLQQKSKKIQGQTKRGWYGIEQK